MKKRIARLATALTLGALAAAGITLTVDAAVTTPQDTAWGAPATPTSDSSTATSAVDGMNTAVTPLDTAWG